MPLLRGCCRVAAVLATGLLLSWAATAIAVQPDETLSDPALEGRARALSKELRCLVCQNQSIDDSNAELARDLRIIVRERLTAGDGDEEVLKYIVDRYGDFVLLRPPLKPATYALWIAPLFLLVAGLLFIRAYLRRHRYAGPAPVSPLTAEERVQLDRLLATEEETP
ncbi:MAG: cytochrome c-type biogenesis protein [Dongiaceae bacterium]